MGLSTSNEPSIGQRLKETYRDFKDIMDEFVDDRKMFIYRLIKTRNRLTHMEGDGDDATFTGNDLELATLRLRLLLELCLMKEIGILKEQMKDAVMRNTMFSIIKIDPMDMDWVKDRGWMMIDTVDLTKKFGDKTAVDGLTLHVNDGEVFGFLGPNGAGKTTTVRMLCCLISNTSGEARIDLKERHIHQRGESHPGRLSPWKPDHSNTSSEPCLRSFRIL